MEMHLFLYISRPTFDIIILFYAEIQLVPNANDEWECQFLLQKFFLYKAKIPQNIENIELLQE